MNAIRIVGLLLSLLIVGLDGISLHKTSRNQADNGLIVNLSTDGTYVIATDSFTLASEPPFLQADATMHTTKDGTLTLKETKVISGSDATGTFNGLLYQYKAGNNTMNAEIVVYNGGEFVRFTQSFPGMLKQCNVSDQSGLMSSFPSLNFGKSNVGFLANHGDMFGWGYSVANLMTHPELLRGGEDAGPTVLFDSFGRTFVISAYSNFMAHNMLFDSASGVANYGIMGGTTELPEHFQIDTILYYSPHGINAAIQSWGEVLLTRYQKRRDYMETDFTVNYLGYYTDNGAYYYYHTEPNKTYTDTMLDVVKYAKMSDIPYGYLQYDSWWYYKGVGNGVVNWTALPSVFPGGINNLFEMHGMPVAAHNRYWASDTTYAKKNGGMYDFVVEERKAIPADTKFWGDLMKSSKPWGLVMYEQDWLVTEFKEMQVTHTNVTIARDWMMEMGRGAASHDVTIQYCMALPRHMLQSVEIPVVTQARVSGDYHPGNSQWKIGVTSMFAHALHVAPFKDTFWTTSMQPGSPYGTQANEPNVALQAAISTLSTGPVGPSDAVDKTTVDLLMKCCRADGLIIKPSRAITSTNQNIYKLAFPNQIPGAPNDEAEVYSTYSDLRYFGSNFQTFVRFGILLAADLTVTSYEAGIDMMYLDSINPAGTKYVAYQGHPGTDMKLYNVSGTTKLKVPACGLKDFQLWHVSPVIALSPSSEVVILGERSKWVPISSRRIQQVTEKSGNILIDVMGKPDEVVTMDFMMGGKVHSTKCTISAAGTIRMSANSQHCITP